MNTYLCGPSPVLAFDISDFMETTLGGLFNHYPKLGLKKSKSRKILGDLTKLQSSCWWSWKRKQDLSFSKAEARSGRVRSCIQGLFEQSPGEGGRRRRMGSGEGGKG